VYKENVRLTEALSYHMREGEVLKRNKDKMEAENESLRGDKELNDLMIQDKVVQTKQQKDAIKKVSHDPGQGGADQAAEGRHQEGEAQGGLT
jgi:N-acetylmuramoyl-L-alanine amidase